MVDRTAATAAEITTLRQELAAAKARIQEMGRHNATRRTRTIRSRRGSRALQRSTICVNAWLHLFAICRGRDCLARRRQ
jgi:hypothetical protein